MGYILMFGGLLIEQDVEEAGSGMTDRQIHCIRSKYTLLS